MVFWAIIIYIVFNSFILEPNSLNVTKYEIQDPQLAGARIVFLSDFHLKKHDYKRLNQIVKLTKKQNPDAVILGGDFARKQNYSSNMDISTIANKLTFWSVSESNKTPLYSTP